MHINEIILVGELVRPAEIAYGETGQPIVSATLCIREISGDKVFKTSIPVEVWGKAAETMREAAAGQLVLVRGKLSFRKRGEKPELAVVSWSVQVAPGTPGVGTGR